MPCREAMSRSSPCFSSAPRIPYAAFTSASPVLAHLRPQRSCMPTVSRRRCRPTNPQRARPHQHQEQSTARALYNLPSQKPPTPPDNYRAPDYHANVGSVIDRLRDFYPNLLQVEPDLSYFSPRVVLCDATGYRISGHEAYRAAFWMLRAQMRVLLAGSKVSITSLYYDDEAGVIYLRWRVEGCFRGWVLVGGGGFVVDGMSVYTLDWRGFVGVHQLENGVRNRGKGVRVLFEDIMATGKVGQVNGVGVGAGGGGYGGANWFVGDGEGDVEDVEREGQSELGGKGKERDGA